MTRPHATTERVYEARRSIEAACHRSGRDPATVVLIGASKRQTVQRMLEAYQAGLRFFGENQIQEAAAKQPGLPADVEWHLIGHLQSNKVKLAVELFDVVHSLDRIKIARSLDRVAETQGKRLRGFVEVNLGNEVNKHGFAPVNLPSQIEPLSQLAQIEVVGLMAIPPVSQSLQEARSWFRRLRLLRDEIAARPEWSRFSGFLSMGMSHDFEVAIEEGATHVRVGTALFGERPPRHPAPS